MVVSFLGFISSGDTSWRGLEDIFGVSFLVIFSSGG